MLKIILSIFRRDDAAKPLSIDPEKCLQWLRDPLSHPALAAMNERELGDLPFRR